MKFNFFEDGNFSNVTGRLKLEGIVQIELSPISPLRIATFVPEKKSIPGSAKIFSYPKFEQLASKSFFKAQECSILWNSLGNTALFLSRNDVDKTGKSYYGETAVHLLSSDGKSDSNITLKKEGPIYDASWSPNGKEFALVYGFMPAQTTLFDLKSQPIADFGTGSKNTVKFSPNGKLLCIAGFGNLAGNMDIWDPKKIKKTFIYGSWSFCTL